MAEINMKDEETVIAHTVGYMLKMIKNNKDISGGKKEFNCIKHGNYNEFIKLIGSEIPIMVVGGVGIEPTVLGNGDRVNELNFLKGECDFIQLNAAGPSMYSFLNKFLKQHGNFIDNDITNITYKKLAMFEIRIRTHASNRKLIVENDTLITIIEKLSKSINLSNLEIVQLHLGRKFLNTVKHNENPNYDWSANTIEFHKAYDILSNNKIKLI